MNSGNLNLTNLIFGNITSTLVISVQNASHFTANKITVHNCSVISFLEIQADHIQIQEIQAESSSIHFFASLFSENDLFLDSWEIHSIDQLNNLLLYTGNQSLCYISNFNITEITNRSQLFLFDLIFISLADVNLNNVSLLSVSGFRSIFSGFNHFYANQIHAVNIWARKIFTSEGSLFSIENSSFLSIEVVESFFVSAPPWSKLDNNNLILSNVNVSSLNGNFIDFLSFQDSTISMENCYFSNCFTHNFIHLSVLSNASLTVSSCSFDSFPPSRVLGLNSIFDLSFSSGSILITDCMMSNSHGKNFFFE